MKTKPCPFPSPELSGPRERVNFFASVLQVLLGLLSEFCIRSSNRNLGILRKMMSRLKTIIFETRTCNFNFRENVPNNIRNSALKKVIISRSSMAILPNAVVGAQPKGRADCVSSTSGGSDPPRLGSTKKAPAVPACEARLRCGFRGGRGTPHIPFAPNFGRSAHRRIEAEVLQPNTPWKALGLGHIYTIRFRNSGMKKSGY